MQCNRDKSCQRRFSLPEASNSFLVPAITWRVQHKTQVQTRLLRPAASCISLPSELQMKCSHPALGSKRCRKKHAPGEHGSVGRVFSKSLCNVCCKGGQQEREPRKRCSPAAFCRRLRHVAEKTSTGAWAKRCYRQPLSGKKLLIQHREADLHLIYFK